MSDIWAVGGSAAVNGAGGIILHYNGTAWSPAASGTTRDLYGVWGASASDVWAVGSFGTILHFDGTSWTAGTSSGITLFLGSLWGSSATDIWIVGGQGTILHGPPAS